MNLVSKYTESSPLLKTVNYILDSVDDKGGWGGTDFEDWAPVITALTLEMLLRAGFTPDTEWVIVHGSTLKHASLTKTISYLNACIRDDGSFGEDIWDAARFGTIIESLNLKDRVEKYTALKKYVLEYVSSGRLKQTDHTWSGPGSIAAVIDYLDSAQESGAALPLFQELLTLQFADGSFHGPVNEVNDEFVHPIWHTSQVMMTTLRRIPSEKDQRIQNMVQFIGNCQDRSRGCWRAFSRFDVYFTAYAVIALSRLTAKPRNIIDSAAAWLSGQVSESGKVRDAGGTLMAALAFCAQFPEQLEFRATLADMRRIEKAELVVHELNETVERLKTGLKERDDELVRYRKRFDHADIVLSKADVFKWAVLLGILGIAVTTAIGIAPFLLMPKQQPQVIYLGTAPTSGETIPDLKNKEKESLSRKEKSSEGSPAHLREEPRKQDETSH